VRELLDVLDEDTAARSSALDPICGQPAVPMNFSRDNIVEVAFDE